MSEEPKAKPKRRAPTAKRKKEANDQAVQIVSVVEATAIAIAGPDAEIRPIEHLLIDEPLAAVLARVEPGSLERANSVLAPVLLACGLALYGARVLGLVQEREAGEKASEAPGLKPINYAAQPGTLRREGEA